MTLYAGLMSGTSLDGVDVALVRFEGEEERPDTAELVAFASRPYGMEFRRRLRRACGEAPAEELCDLAFALGRRFARATSALLGEAELPPGALAAVGSHGQTVWHEPPGGGGKPGSTLQLGEAAVIAEELGVPVISDFRVRDVAAGGHGAPLTPYFDALLLRDDRVARGIQNLGGIGNLTALPPTGSPEAPVAFDTGPGNVLLDAAAERLSGGEARMDRDGRTAASGQVIPAALEEWCEDPFFSEEPPRSTGRERFGPERLARWLERHRDHSAADLMATLTELTARSVAESLRHVDFDLEELFLTGGGARNPELVRRLRRGLPGTPVRPLGELGWDPDAREAAAFALLARQHLLAVPASVPWATGARGPRILGKRTPA